MLIEGFVPPLVPGSAPELLDLAGIDAVSSWRTFSPISPPVREPAVDLKSWIPCKQLCPRQLDLRVSQVAGEYLKQGKQLEQDGDLAAARNTIPSHPLLFAGQLSVHLKGDELAEQAQLQGNIAYRCWTLLPVPLKVLKIPFRDKEINGYLHLPTDDHVVPVVMVSGSIDSLISIYRLYERHRAERHWHVDPGICRYRLFQPVPLGADTSRVASGGPALSAQ